MAVGALLALPACGEPDLDLAEAGLLRAGDLGEGWIVVEGEEGEARPFRSGAGDEPEACERLILRSEAGTIADGQSAAFLDREPGPDVDALVLAVNFVSVFRDDTVATRAHDAWQSVDDVQPCLELLLGALVEIGAATDPLFSLAFGSYEVSASSLEVSTAGDGVVGWRGTLDLESAALPDGSTETVTFVLDLVAARAGRAVTQVMLMGIDTEPPTEARDAAVAAVVDRLSAAEGS